ncbi:MAG TPA: hypothetical protein VHC49_06390 [Mycobacteriales bacterium]|nr:hypothetical protein [Mycobacteriales bacterium]
MSTDPARRRGRRDNGLDAAFYVPLADVDPRIGEHLLDVLWAAGVPAYLEPPVEPGADAMPDSAPTSTLRRPLPPVDRLWVDRDRRADARSIVESEAPRMPEPSGSPESSDPPETTELDPDVEREWAAIVAAYEADPTDPVPPWPAAEDLDVRTRPEEPPAQWSAPPEPEVDEGILEEDEGHYEPPPPPPFPRPSGYTMLALLILALGVICIFFPDLVQASESGGFAFGVICVLGSAGIFIWRLHDRHPDDPEDPDDGAIV